MSCLSHVLLYPRNATPNLTESNNKPETACAPLSRPWCRGLGRVKNTNLRGLDGGVDVALGLPLQLPHAEHALHLFDEAAVADERGPALIRQVRVRVAVAKGLPEQKREEGPGLGVSIKKEVNVRVHRSALSMLMTAPSAADRHREKSSPLCRVTMIQSTNPSLLLVPTRQKSFTAWKYHKKIRFLPLIYQLRPSSIQCHYCCCPLENGVGSPQCT